MITLTTIPASNERGHHQANKRSYWKKQSEIALVLASGFGRKEPRPAIMLRKEGMAALCSSSLRDSRVSTLELLCKLEESSSNLKLAVGQIPEARGVTFPVGVLSCPTKLVMSAIVHFTLLKPSCPEFRILSTVT